MPEPQTTIAAGGIGAAIIGFFTRRLINRFDANEQRISVLEQRSATKDDLTVASMRIESAIDRGNQQMLETVNTRIDDLYRALPKRGGD